MIEEQEDYFEEDYNIYYSFGYLLIGNRLYLHFKLLFLKLEFFLSAHFFSLFFNLERLI